MDYFLNQLELIRPLFKSELKYKIDTTKLYMYIMHQIDVDVENDFIVRKQSFILVMNEFKQVYKRTGSLFAKLMINMYEYGFCETAKIRNIS